MTLGAPCGHGAKTESAPGGSVTISADVAH